MEALTFRAEPIIAAQAGFSKIDEDMWK